MNIWNRKPKEEYFSEKSTYLGKSHDEQPHKLFLGNSIFKKDINGKFCLFEGNNNSEFGVGVLLIIFLILMICKQKMNVDHCH